MTAPQPSVRRVLAQEVMGLPEGHVVRPTTPADVTAFTALVRAVDISGCGHSSTNIEEVTDVIARPRLRVGVRIGHGMARDGPRRWSLRLRRSGQRPRLDDRCVCPPRAMPGPTRSRAPSSMPPLSEGRYRWDALYMDPEVPLPTAKARLLRQRRRHDRRPRATRVRRGASLLADEGGPLVGRGSEQRSLIGHPAGSLGGGGVAGGVRDPALPGRRLRLARDPRGQFGGLPRSLRLHAARVRRMARAPSGGD